MKARVISVEDEGALAFVDKPSGMLVHSSQWAGPREHTLVDELRALLPQQALHPLHRLDRQTSGVVAFARDASAWALDEKVYWALVRGHVKEPVEIDHPIKDDETGVVREAQSRVRPLLQSSVDRCCLVEVTLLTGRRHQARRHLKHISHPVIGDASHGKGPINRAYRDAYGLARLALHARRLVVTPSPVRATNVRFEGVSPLPPELVDAYSQLFGPEPLRDLG